MNCRGAVRDLPSIAAGAIDVSRLDHRSCPLLRWSAGHSKRAHSARAGPVSQNQAVHIDTGEQLDDVRGQRLAPLVVSRADAGNGFNLPDDRYLNRELSWLDFNERVLALAEDTRQPLLERAKF